MNAEKPPPSAPKLAEAFCIPGADLLRPLLNGASPAPSAAAPVLGIVIGELLALGDDGATAFVRYPGQVGSAACTARTAVDLGGGQIGAALVLMFESGDPARPVVVGVLRGGTVHPEVQAPGCVEVDADGQRMLIKAHDQLVLRCGDASITLTKAGKVLIEGRYVCSRATGTNRIKGGSVQLN